MGWTHKRERKKGTVYRDIVRIIGYPQQQKTFNRLTDAKLWVQQTEASIRTGEQRNGKAEEPQDSETLQRHLGRAVQACRTIGLGREFAA